ncbi:MAG: hypothetical protein MUC50_18635, partial [Myxococcota bacterium]|nr:hypothetical protein [Myxococcota bacterium]
DWQKPGNIIGALISSEGELLAEDILMMEDHAMANEGDQRFNAISYNPVANTFLTTWSDTRPDWMNAAIGARFVKSDGTVEGDAFPIVDFTGAQMIAYPVFIEALPGYLVAYEHDDKDLDVHYFMDTTAQLDVRVRWMDEAGAPISDTQLRLAVGEANQRFVRAAYSTKSHVALVVWQEDDGKTSDPTGHMTATGGNIMAAIVEATSGG